MNSWPATIVRTPVGVIFCTTPASSTLYKLPAESNAIPSGAKPALAEAPVPGMTLGPVAGQVSRPTSSGSCVTPPQVTAILVTSAPPMVAGNVPATVQVNPVGWVLTVTL